MKKKEEKKKNAKTDLEKILLALRAISKKRTKKAS
jgi:hypothetical protein